MGNVARFSAFILLVFLSGCAATLPPLSPAAERLVVGRNDPTDGHQEIGLIEAVHGRGCGGFGVKGSYEGAYRELRNQAAEMGATYVQILMMTEPHLEGGCYRNQFILRGRAFRR